MTDSTVAFAREILFAQMADGLQVACPCCDQSAKIYPRTISGTMAKQLAILYRRNGWTYYRDLATDHPSGDKDYGKLHYWGLADGDGSANWRITDLGRQFVEGAVEMPRVAKVYNGEVVGWSDDYVTFADCTDGFDLATLMNPAAVV